MKEIKKIIRGFVVENFLSGDGTGLTDDSSFFDEGIIDSTGLLELIDFLEEEFDVIIDEDTDVEKIDSLKNLETFIAELLS